MKVGVTKEIYPGECRVAATPETARRLIEKFGFDVILESEAGAAASFPDDSYREVGCTICDDAATVWREADIVLKVRSPQEHEVEQLREGQKLIANAASLYSLRDDIQGEATAANLRQAAQGPLIPIHLGPGLLVYLDNIKRREFLARWRRAMARE